MKELRDYDSMMRTFRKLVRLLGYWVGYTGVYSSVSACPFCGKPSCPSGVAWSGAVGIVLTLFTLSGRRFFRRFRRISPDLDNNKGDCADS